MRRFPSFRIEAAQDRRDPHRGGLARVGVLGERQDPEATARSQRHGYEPPSVARRAASLGQRGRWSPSSREPIRSPHVQIGSVGLRACSRSRMPWA